MLYLIRQYLLKPQVIWSYIPMIRLCLASFYPCFCPFL